MDVFIGRSADLEKIFSDIKTVEEGIVWDVIGIHGMGKATLLKKLTGEVEGLPRRDHAVATRELAQDVEGPAAYRGDHGPRVSSAALLHTLRRSLELVRWLAGALSGDVVPEELSALALFCASHGKAVDELAARHEVRSRSEESTAPTDADGVIKARIRALQSELDATFLDAVGEFAASRRVLLVLQRFESVAEHDFGQWIVNTALRLPRTVTIVSRVPVGGTLIDPRPGLKTLELRNFTEAEVGQYLQARYVGAPIAPDIPHVVHVVTDGHPAAVELTGTLISKIGTDMDTAEKLRQILDQLPNAPDDRCNAIVDEILKELRDDELKRAVEVASVVRTFDAVLLLNLLGIPVEESGRAVELLRLLERLRLAQPDPNDDRQGRFRLLEFIRVGKHRAVRQLDSLLWAKVHQLAAEHYFTLLSEYEETSDGASYNAWRRYESAEWQANKRMWLYHSGMLNAQPEQRALTRARFVLVFLEGFWWWGCYHDFPFSTKLIADWELASSSWSLDQRSGEARLDQQLGAELRILLKNYPLGHVKPATAAWKATRDALLMLRRLCRLENDRNVGTKPERRERIRADALVNVFVAHTWRFSDPHDRNAEDYYDKALRALEWLKDDWVVSWILFELADLALERGDLSLAVTRIAEATRRALEYALSVEPDDAADDDDFPDFGEPAGEWDFELLANLHRARADVHWLAGELDQAAREYGRAVANAFWFQGEDQEPEEYSQRFYGEVTGRAMYRICELAGDPAAAARFAELVTAEVPRPLGSPAPPLDLGGAPAALAAALFPPAPQDADLQRANTEFMTLWVELREHRRDPATVAQTLLVD